MNDCVFCKIVCGEIPSQKLYEDDDLIVIRDIEPKAKLHYLCIPKEHFALLSEMDEGRAELLKRCFQKFPTCKSSSAWRTAIASSSIRAKTGGRRCFICTFMFWAASA